jgi:prepilin peptidase CpaA
MRMRRIPNRLVVVLAVTGLGYALASNASPWVGLLHGTAGVLTGFVLWLPFYAFHWLGAGDVKFFAAAGAWLGPMRAIEGALVAALVGGALALVWMVRAYGMTEMVAMTSLAVRSPKTVAIPPADAKSRRAIPYGVALAVGAMTAAWFPDLLTRMFHAAP